MATKTKATNTPEKVVFDEKFVIRNLDTGEVINITEVPKTGVVGLANKKKNEETPSPTKGAAPATKSSSAQNTSSSEPRKLTNSAKAEPVNNLQVLHGESPVVNIEIYLESIDKSKTRLPVRVKMEDKAKFASMYTVKLHKQTTYKLRVVITPSPAFHVAGVEEFKFENHRVKLKQESGKAVGAAYEIEGEWNVPSSAIATSDAVRHIVPIHLSFKVCRNTNKEESSVISFIESFQAKIYNGEVSNAQTGNILNSFSTACNIKTHDAISGISYNLSN